jgi:Xaa-Pro aminopeptidase
MAYFQGMFLVDRLRKCTQLFEPENIDAFITFYPVHLQYLIGFTGSSGALVVHPDGAVFFTDGRYTEQAREEVHGAEIFITARGQTLVEAVAKSNCIPPGRRIGFEASRLSFQQVEKLKTSISSSTWIPIQSVVDRLRRKKSSEEIVAIQQAIRITETAFEETVNRIKPGVSERELAIELDHLLRQSGADGTGFETIVAFGERSALPHARPTDRALRSGDAVLIDCGAVVNGYHADMTRTLFAGRAPEDFRSAYDTVRRAHRFAVESAAPGTSCRQMDDAVRCELGRFADFFSHSLGHGLGLDVHETPTLSAASDETLQTGDVVTIEPGVYFPGQFGIRIENDVWISDSGPVDLMNTTIELIELAV